MLKSTTPTLTDTDDVSLSDEDFPFSFFPLLIFLHTFLATTNDTDDIMRIHLVYVITFSSGWKCLQGFLNEDD